MSAGSYWDPRLEQRRVRLVKAPASPGQRVWRVIRGEFWDVNRSAGKHHIYVDVLDEYARRLTGVPLRVWWPTGETRIFTEAKIGEPAAGNFPMTPGKNAFNIKVDDALLSDEVYGIGMGDDTPSGFNAGIHTSTFLVFQRTVASTVPPLPPAPQPPVEPGLDVHSRLLLVQMRLESGQDALNVALSHFGAAQAMLQQVIDRIPRG